MTTDELARAATWQRAWFSAWHRWREAVDLASHAPPRLVLRCLQMRARAATHYRLAYSRVEALTAKERG